MLLLEHGTAATGEADALIAWFDSRADAAASREGGGVRRARRRLTAVAGAAPQGLSFFRLLRAWLAALM